MTSPARLVLEWMDDRVAWSRMRNHLAARRVPLHSPAYYLGGIAVFLLLLEVASGVLLLMEYRPGVAEAHASVVRIASAVPFGGIVRGIHLWSGDLFLIALAAHLFSVLVRRTFRPPGELIWQSGLLLLTVSVCMALTGAVLPWGQEAAQQSRVAGELAANIPWVGHAVRRLVLGGDEVSAITLDRAFGFHAAVLPAIVTLLLGAHFALLRARPLPISPEVEHAREPTIPFYPDFFVRQGAVWCGVLLAVLTLATFVPRSPGAAADLSLPSPAGAHPPWFFAFLHTVVQAAPRDMLGVPGGRFVVGAALAGFVLLMFLPFIDRRGSKLTLYLAWLALATFVVLTAYGLA